MFKPKNIEINALVKGDSLAAYGWGHEEGIMLIDKLTTIDEENNIDLYQSYNIDRDEWGGVTTDQIIITNDDITKTKPSHENTIAILINGPEVFVKYEDNEE